MRIAALTLILPLITLGGCVIAVNGDDAEDGWHSRQTRNERAVAHLELGRSRASVEAQMGEPDFEDAFRRHGSKFVVLYYRTHRAHNDGRTTRDETTPLVFVDGSLVGWGDSAIDHATAH